jgi:hypothetical protein
MSSRPGAITLMDLSNVTLAPNDQTIGGETLVFLGINSPEIESLRGDGSTGHARKEKGHREGHEGDHGRDLKGTLVPGRQGGVA